MLFICLYFGIIANTKNHLGVINNFFSWYMVKKVAYDIKNFKVSIWFNMVCVFVRKLRKRIITIAHILIKSIEEPSFTPKKDTKILFYFDTSTFNFMPFIKYVSVYCYCICPIFVFVFYVYSILRHLARFSVLDFLLLSVTLHGLLFSIV